MRASVVAISLLLAMTTVVRAEPCVNVTAIDASDAATVKRAMLAAIPATPRSCLDVAVTTTMQQARAGDVSLTTSVRVVISDEHGKMTSVIAGGATAHVGKPTAKLPLYRRDALEQAVTGVAPSIRAHLITLDHRPSA